MFAAAYTFALASEKKKADMHMAVHTLLHCLLKKKQAGMHMAVHTLLHCLLEKNNQAEALHMHTADCFLPSSMQYKVSLKSLYIIYTKRPLFAKKRPLFFFKKNLYQTRVE